MPEASTEVAPHEDESNTQRENQTSEQEDLYLRPCGQVTLPQPGLGVAEQVAIPHPDLLPLGQTAKPLSDHKGPEGKDTTSSAPEEHGQDAPLPPDAKSPEQDTEDAGGLVLFYWEYKCHWEKVNLAESGDFKQNFGADWKPCCRTSELAEYPLAMEALRVESVDLNCAQNCTNHNTQFFSDQKLIVRRGQTFGFYVHFQNREWNDEKDKITFTVETGPKPCESLGTKSIFPLGGCPDQCHWNASFKSHDAKCLRVNMFPPANACVGCYSLNMCLVSCDHTNSQNLGDFYVLFNPWCSDDPVYLDSQDQREEYVLNEHGIIFQGLPEHITAHPWHFGQFQDGILDICLKMLDTSTNFLRDPAMDCSCRNDPLYISRVLNNMIGCHKKKSILKLPSNNNLLQGLSPLTWNGSVPILRQWYQSRCKPIKYGDCATFASVLCT
ncbi:Protein-glutamine gamma-glutamyltransferase 2, partial [Varanus komodoensis]